MTNPGENPRLRQLRQALDEANGRLKALRLDDPRRNTEVLIIRDIEAAIDAADEGVLA